MVYENTAFNYCLCSVPSCFDAWWSIDEPFSSLPVRFCSFWKDREGMSDFGCKPENLISSSSELWRNNGFLAFLIWTGGDATSTETIVIVIISYHIYDIIHQYLSKYFDICKVEDTDTSMHLIFCFNSVRARTKYMRTWHGDQSTLRIICRVSYLVVHSSILHFNGLKWQLYSPKWQYMNPYSLFAGIYIFCHSV